MKRKTREQSLQSKIHSLQSELYDYASKMEERADKCKNKDKKKTLTLLAQYATNAGFEMDEVGRQFEYTQDLLS